LLFRRYIKDHWIGNKLADAHFSFPPSLNRGRFSEPDDVIYSEDGSLDGYGVLEFTVADIPKSLQDQAGTEYVFFPVHMPCELNYSHSEIHSEREQQRGQPANPSSATRKKFRAMLSQKINVRIPAQI